MKTLKRDWKNPPNFVTAVRLVGSFFLPVFILGSTATMQWIGFALFVVLAASDKLDGWMAKNIYGSTEFGQIFDAIVDKALIFITLMSLIIRIYREGNNSTATMLLLAAVVIAIRETFVAVIRFTAQRKLERVDSAIQSGRITMVMTSVALATLLLPSDSPIPMLSNIQLALLWLSIGMSLLSGLDYYRKYR